LFNINSLTFKQLIKTKTNLLMNKNALYIIAILACAAAIGMKVMAKNSRTTELENYWWIPLPVALICLVIAGARKQ
jgi:hypothetical protein